LEQLQLRPQEWDNPVLDLEPLELQERQRAALLREQLPAEALAQTGAGALPDWALLSRGRGLLPPQAAGELERQGLEQRWLSLQACLEQLGPGERRPVAWRGLSGELPWHGGQLVLVHTARPRTPQRLRLWGELLLACAAGQGPSGAALVGRDGPRFRVLEQLQAPSAAEAEPLLEQLLAWSHSHRTQCWPIPPQTGWAYASGEAAKPGQGRGWSLALSAWEGGHQQPAERREAVQALCFGADLPLSQLLTPERQQLALALHTPLLERRTELKR
jgi:exodeoxyribonuclease V gamma subunit